MLLQQQQQQQLVQAEPLAVLLTSQPYAPQSQPGSGVPSPVTWTMASASTQPAVAADMHTAGAAAPQPCYDGASVFSLFAPSSAAAAAGGAASGSTAALTELGG